MKVRTATCDFLILDYARFFPAEYPGEARGAGDSEKRPDAVDADVRGFGI